MKIEICYIDCSHKYKINQGVMVGGRRPLVEDNLWGKMTFEDIIWWKMTFSGRQPLVEDDLQWKTTFGGRRHLVEDKLWWKTSLGGRWPSVEDDLCWNTTFGGRWPAMKDNLQWKTTFVGFLHAAYSALRPFFHVFNCFCCFLIWWVKVTSYFRFFS